MAIKSHLRCSAVCCILAFVLGALRPASAARLLDVYVEQDGKVVLHTYYEDGGRADAATVWRYLSKPPIMVDEDSTSLEASSEQPLRLNLKGKLELRIEHAKRVIVRTELSELELRRANQQTPEWFLSEAEVERTAFIAGLGPPGPPVTQFFDGYVAAIAASLLILFACVVLTVLLLRGPKTSDSGS